MTYLAIPEKLVFHVLDRAMRHSHLISLSSVTLAALGLASVKTRQPLGQRERHPVPYGMYQKASISIC